ncbi:MAG: CzcE family metal-binding protein [Massilia sp.]|nr:CzcE family metal-binding protein [Massilia sp.]MDB5950407.1 CzcE family metal-binding protein [Massilia sp.]
MKTTSLVRAAMALALSLPGLSSMAAMQRLDLLGDPAPPTAAGRTIAITPDTKFVNVQGGEVVRFDVGGKSFAWSFNGSVAVTSFDLARVAPSGMLDHTVTAYVSPNPMYIGGE